MSARESETTARILSIVGLLSRGACAPPLVTSMQGTCAITRVGMPGQQARSRRSRKINYHPPPVVLAASPPRARSRRGRNAGTVLLVDLLYQHQLCRSKGGCHDVDRAIRSRRKD